MKKMKEAYVIEWISTRFFATQLFMCKITMEVIEFARIYFDTHTAGVYASRRFIK